jgi:lipopolysaccharide export system permease protein
MGLDPSVRGSNMFIMDRYLLRQFVQTFVICFLSLVGLFIIIDLFTNLEEFVTCGRKAGGVLPFVAKYYSYQSIMFFDRTGGVLALVSAMFTVSWIQRHNEMVALMAAGVSRFRVLLPIIIAVGFVSLLMAANRELLIPRFRHELSKRSQDPAGNNPQPLALRPDGRTGVIFQGKCTHCDERSIDEPIFRMPMHLYDYGPQLTADKAYYKPPEGNRPGGYLFDGVRRPKNLSTCPSLPLKGEPVLITPCDAPEWLKPDQCFLVSDVDFDQLVGGKDLTQMSSTAELIRGLRNPSLAYGGQERVAVHARIVQPLLDMTLLFLGLPLIVTRESRNVFVAMGVCMFVTTAFTLVVAGSQNMGAISYWPPSVAAWVPLMIFVPLAAWLVENLWK